MAPPPQQTALSPKIAILLELMQLINQSEAKLKHLQGMAIPHMNQQLLEAFEIENPDPKSDRDVVGSRNFDPVAVLAGKDVGKMISDFEDEAEMHLRQAKVALVRDYRILLKALLVSVGVHSLAPKTPHSELDLMVLQNLGTYLIDGYNSEKEEEEEEEAKKPKKKPRVEEPQPKKKVNPKPVQEPKPKPSVSTVDAAEQVVSVADWLRARGFNIGKHATACLDRTLGFGTELLFTQGLNKATGGTLGSLLEENKTVHDLLKGLLEDNTGGGEQ